MPVDDPDNVSSAWREDADAERSIAGARNLFEAAVYSSDLSITERVAFLQHGCEPMLDAAGGAPSDVAETARLVAKLLQQERSELPAETYMRLMVAIEVVHARGLHCAGRSPEAFRGALATLTNIEHLAGGPTELHRALGHPGPHLLGELTHSVLGIMAASLKRSFPHGHRSREFWTNEFRTLIDAHNRDPEKVTVYPGTPSLIQSMYLLTEGANPEDTKRVSFLYELDKRARPKDRRAKSTIPLREVAHARYRQDLLDVHRHTAAARESLREVGLERHLRVVDKNDYLGDDDA